MNTPWTPNVQPNTNPNAIPTTGNWLKWLSGQTKRIQILSSQAQQRLVHWIGDKGQDCSGPACGLCHAGSPAKVRWTVSVAEGESKLTWEMANMTYRDLCIIGEQSGGIKGLMLNVTRAGEGRQTRYILVPMGIQPLPADTSTTSDPAAQIKALCTELELTPPQLITLWKDTTDHVFDSAPADQQLAQVLKFAQGLKAEKTAEKATEPATQPTLEALLA